MCYTFYNTKLGVQKGVEETHKSELLAADFFGNGNPRHLALCAILRILRAIFVLPATSLVLRPVTVVPLIVPDV